MGDNKRWFKVWTTILIDDGMMDMSMEERGRWVTLGALAAHNGESGVLTMKIPRLSELLRVTPEELPHKIGVLPNLIVSDPGNGTITVTFKNWNKYQVDNSLERVHKYRERKAEQELAKEEEKPVKQAKPRTVFVPPTEEEVREYCELRASKGFPRVDSARWYNHYKAIGWMVGGKYKTPMKDWKAAVHTWERPGEDEKHREAAKEKLKGLYKTLERKEALLRETEDDHKAWELRTSIKKIKKQIAEAEG